MADFQTYPKKRLSIIIEAPYLSRLLEKLDGLDVPGYTVLPGARRQGAPQVRGAAIPSPRMPAAWFRS